MTDDRVEPFDTMDRIPSISGGADIKMGLYHRVTVVRGTNGKLYAELDSLENWFYYLMDMQKTFAERQCKDMAAQASYDVGKYQSLETTFSQIMQLKKFGAEICPYI